MVVTCEQRPWLLPTRSEIERSRKIQVQDLESVHGLVGFDNRGIKIHVSYGPVGSIGRKGSLRSGIATS